MKLICPRCGSVDIHPHALKAPNGVCQRVICYGCGKTFLREYKRRPNPVTDIKIEIPDFGSATGMSGVPKLATGEYGVPLPVTREDLWASVRRNQFLHRTLEAGDRAVALFDPHLDPQRGPHSSYLVAKKYVMEEKPEWIIFGGDFLEFNSLCAWDFNKRLLMENKRYKEDIEMGIKELSEVREACPNSQIAFFAGNHEYRVPRYVEQHPEVKGMLNVEKDLHLDDLGIKWIEYNQTMDLGELTILHGYYWNVHYAKTTLLALGCNCIFGHTHRSQTYTQRLHADLTPHVAHGIGCLTDLDPQWKRGLPTNHINSFAIVEYHGDKGFFNIYEPIIINGAFRYGGQTWKV